MYSSQHAYGILTGHLGQRSKILPMICHIVKKQKNQEKLKTPNETW